MKNRFFLLVSILFFISILLISQQKNVREDVVVVNVEVPVRVMYKGKPVDNLKKSDFRLFENGKKVEINGFNLIRKKINIQNIGLTSERKQFFEPRFFVLVFNLVEYNHHVREGLEYIFQNVLRKSDKLMVLANNKLMSFENLSEKKRKKEIILRVLKREGLIAKGILLKYMRDMKYVVPFESRRINMSHIAARNYLKRYLKYLREFKFRYYNADINKYYNFAKYLKKIRLKKWVINFYQLQVFPHMKVDSMIQSIYNLIGRLQVSDNGEENSFSTLLSQMLKKVEEERNFDNTFPTEEISKLFYNVNTTFNTVFIPLSIESFEKDMEYKRIATSLENNLREITKKTGGTLLTTANLKEAMKTISEKEDILYMLTYAPDEGEKPGKIRVTVKNRKYKVLYDDNIRADYITDYLKKRSAKERIIGMENLKFVGKELSFVLNNFKTVKNKGKIEADLKVKITIKDNDGKSLYEKEKIVKTSKDIAHFNIGFRWLKPGKYDLMVDVTDLQTQRSAFEYKKIEVK